MTNDKMTLRNKLVDIALDWQDNFGGTCPYDSINVILSFVIFGIFINNSTAKVTNKS